MIPKLSKLDITKLYISLILSTSQENADPSTLLSCCIIADKTHTSRKFNRKPFPFALESRNFFWHVCRGCFAFFLEVWVFVLFENTNFLHTLPPQRPTHLHDRVQPLFWEIQRHLFLVAYFLLTKTLLFFRPSPQRQIECVECLVLPTSEN